MKLFAKTLQENTPKSELWFYSLYNSFKDKNDLLNYPIFGYIPDIINKKYKYVIEIDGSIHDLPHIKAKDKIKDKIYRQYGFTPIRIKAYDILSFKAGMDRILKKRCYPITRIVIKDKQNNILLDYEFVPKIIKRNKGEAYAPNSEDSDKAPVKYIIRRKLTT